MKTNQQTAEKIKQSVSYWKNNKEAENDGLKG